MTDLNNVLRFRDHFLPAGDCLTTNSFLQRLGTDCTENTVTLLLFTGRCLVAVVV
jgi:hypothetical protein